MEDKTQKSLQDALPHDSDLEAAIRDMEEYTPYNLDISSMEVAVRCMRYMRLNPPTPPPCSVG